MSRNMPEVRFGAFSEDWESPKLEEVVEDVSGNDGRTDLPVLTISAGNGWMNQKDRFSQVIAGNELKNYTLLKKGELSYNHGNSKLAKYGAVFELKDYEEALVPRVYHSFKSNDKSSPTFLENLFLSKIPDRELGKLVTSGARMDGLLNINKQAFFGITISVPKLEEQQKIGTLFKQLDDTIVLHQELVNQQQQYKKAMLQRMFPKNGEKFPELRFPEFTNAWEQRKLGDLLESAYQGINTAGDKVEYSDSGVKVLQSKHITSGTISFDDARYLDKERYSEYFPKYVPNVDDILFANIGTIGPSTVVTDGKEFLVAWNILKMTPRDEANSKFIQLQLQRLNSQRYFEKVTTGNATKFVNKDEMLGTQIVVPEKKEQSKIGDFFADLDHLITLHQKKLEDYQQLKKALLQRMFV